MTLAARCPNRVRHWFTQYGAPTCRLPRCAVCGAPNPKWERQRPEMVAMIGEADVRAIEQEMENADD